MAPSLISLDVQLRQLIFYHLDHESLENANFLAGRLLALDSRNADSAHLLALTYYRMRRHKAAHDTAREHGASGKHLGCAYVFALACNAIGRYKEGIAALERAKELWTPKDHWNKHSETSRRHLPDASAVLNLLGRLFRGHGDLLRAGESFYQSHKANPFTWDAFKGLCEIGAEVDSTKCFNLTAKMSEPCVTAPEVKTIDHIKAEKSGATSIHDPFVTAPSTKSGHEWSFQFSKIKTKNLFTSPSKSSSLTDWDTPTFNGVSIDDDVDMGGCKVDEHVPIDDNLAPPIRRSKTLSRLGLETSKDSSKGQAPSLKYLGRSQSETTEKNTESTQVNGIAGIHKRSHSGHASNAPSDATTLQLRRSNRNRLFGQLGTSKIQDPKLTKRVIDPKKTTAISLKGRGTSTVGRVVSGNRKILPPVTSIAEEKEMRAPSRNGSFINTSTQPIKAPTTTIVLPDTSPIETLLSLLKGLGLGYYALCRFDCRQASKIFESVAPAQKETVWVLAQLGKAYYQTAEYIKAQNCFARMMKLDPTVVKDTEYYSTVLWQLNKPIQLAFLAHTLKESDFEAPETWCALGNAFSLNREHEQAIGCFKRATQIDPTFSYAWTLMGHELLTNEEFDAALTAYRKGVGSERRGYASWYGLGKCFERMGKLEEAERHYRIAASINKENAVLFVCIGVILERMRHPREALVQYTHAITLAPASALARFRRARTLLNLRIYQDALRELNELLLIAPEEANVWYMLGRCHKALGNRAEAVKCYTTSLNLDAKAAQHIKDAMEAIDDSDEEEEDDGE